MALLGAVGTFFAEDKDLVIIEWLWKIVTASGVTLFLLAVCTPLRVPHGKYKNDSIWGRLLLACKVNARIGWFIQELPSFVVPVFFVLNYGGRYVGEANPNIVLLGMFLLHYAQRVFIYSLFQKGTPSPVIIHIAGFLLCLLNGYMQGRYLTNFGKYDISWFYDPRFILGHILFLLGMAINIHSDAILRGLRKPGEKGYKIPQGGMFEFVSGANYFGETLEWTGYATACWNFPAASFAVFAILYLGPRAVQHHKFYLDKFEDYPQNRKAFIPFLL